MMADNDDVSRSPMSFVAIGSERAPFVYLDGVMGMGSTFGEIQLELAANTVVPIGDGETRTEAVITAHLRCSQAAARILRDSIDKALALAECAADGARIAAAAQVEPAATPKSTQH